MADLEPQPNIDRLLADLRSGDAGRRQAAADAIAEQPVGNAEIVAALRNIARGDHFAVRSAAERALSAIGDLPPSEASTASSAAGAPAPPEPPVEVGTQAPGIPSAGSSPGSPHKPVNEPSHGQKVRDFWIGFLGQILLWALGLVVLRVIGLMSYSDPFRLWLMNVFPPFFLLLNFAIWVWAMIRRSWIGLGMLGAFSAALLLAIVAGIFLLVTCFTRPGSL